MSARTMLDAAITAVDERISQKQVQAADLAESIRLDLANADDLRTARAMLGPEPTDTENLE